MFGINNIDINNDISFSFSLGHSLAPFGDYFEQHYRFIFKKKVKFTVNQFLNKENLFFGYGLELRKYQLTKRIKTSLNLKYWNQPIDQAYLQNKSLSGFAFKLSTFYSLKPVVHLG